MVVAGSAKGSRAERSRRAILEAAAAAFAAHGYAGASLNAIIRDSGLTKGGFYFHFPSKLELALAVIEDRNERWLDRVLVEAGLHQRALDRLFAVPRILARTADDGDGPASLRRLIDELSQDPELRDRVCGGVRAWIEAVTDQFRDAQAEGDISADADVHVLAEVAVGGFVGMQTLSEQLADEGLERRVEILIEVVRAAARPRQGGR